MKWGERETERWSRRCQLGVTQPVSGAAGLLPQARVVPALGHSCPFSGRWTGPCALPCVPSRQNFPTGAAVPWPHSDRGSLPLFSSRPPAWLALTGPRAARDFPESSELTGGAGAGRDQVPPGASKEERRDPGQHKARRPRRGRGPVVDAPGHLGPVTRLSPRSLSTIPGGGRFQEFKGGPWWRCMGEGPRRACACASQVRP